MKRSSMIRSSLVGMFVGIFLPMVALAVSSAYEEAPSIYVLHLSYKNGVISIAPNYALPYDIIYQGDAAPPSTPNGAYKLDILSVRGVSLATIAFDPPAGSTSGSSYFDVQAPYFADAKEVVVMTAAGKMILSVDVSGSSYCNDDGRCDSSVGENQFSCPHDCKSTVVPPDNGGGKITPPSPATTTATGATPSEMVPSPSLSVPPSGALIPTSPAPTPSSVVPTVIWVVLAALFILFATLGAFWYQKRHSSQIPPEA